MKTGFFMLLSVAVICFQSCQHGNNKTRISGNGGHSHNAGRNCMQCHNPNGEGSGWFSAAGTVYDSSGLSVNPNLKVYLYTGRGGLGTIVDSLFGDNSGNFYTTNSIDFSNGLYPAVTGSNGITNYMSSPITIGACNSCHGVSTAKIWAY